METLTPGELVTRIDTDRQQANLSSAIRLYVLDHYRRLASEFAAPSGEGEAAMITGLQIRADPAFVVWDRRDLSRKARAVPSGPQWAYEIKHDGFRFI